ncbi:MAG: hypothetical protein ABUT20_04780 [Bacteroidota bacterium]
MLLNYIRKNLMELNQKHTGENILVKWNYSGGELEVFARWKLLRKSLFHFLFLWVRRRENNFSAVLITSARVFFDDKEEYFHSIDRRLRRIVIKDVGKLNVLEITYELQILNRSTSKEIFIPIPKGKLKEAIEVEEKLMENDR